MKQVLTFVELFLASLFLVLTISHPAMAYVGPGAGLAAIGAFFALVAGIIAALFGFLWYPIKRLLRKRKQSKEEENDRQKEEAQ
ncbi:MULTISPECIES: hypothetical protein [unclassified Okeania]|uniref:Uncharacterized protein n=2 Tax=Microcoleaceae TaxID=1892252 RepID=A0A3N6NDQ1_9CYAN|nr:MULTISPECIES: hypothetical protein [unclassified Okeania]RQH13844.1 hypothetical protein D4Z78_23645 [Okeania hirsuta]NES75050.1 hypothetical protein [Okeania sp. SIO1H4]NES89762.1 hypothetical protein [Okeania sp. SIO2B9]NET19369.1 hypothetical protein [Okeania sp. SIO1H5]NET92996.1 hypothetical protein [Okeania sp. SIO1H2]